MRVKVSCVNFIEALCERLRISRFSHLAALLLAFSSPEPVVLGHVVGKRGRLQIKPSGSGDENVLLDARVRIHSPHALILEKETCLEKATAHRLLSSG